MEEISHQHTRAAHLSSHLFAPVSDPAGAGGGVRKAAGWVMGVIGGDGGYGCYWRSRLHHVICKGGGGGGGAPVCA